MSRERRARLVWFVPEISGGIRDYGDRLWPHVAGAAESAGFEPTGLLTDAPVTRGGVARSVEALRGHAPDLVHVQHEYGLFGGKNPPGYTFPRWVEAVRRALPTVRLIATAHTVLLPDYRFPTRGRGVQAPMRALANRLLLPRLQRGWGPLSWGGLDGVIVHSRLQAPVVAAAGCPRVEVVPHFVREVDPSDRVAPRGGAVDPSNRAAPWGGIPDGVPAVLVFGYVTPEKGQDLAIAALARMPGDTHLILAGGPRRKEDEPYLARCRALAQRAGLETRVHFTGYVPPDRIEAVYARADLVLAPFVATTGSGSLAEALARGKAVLATDLPLNREILEREPGCLALFPPGDAQACAEAARALLAGASRRRAMGEAAARYAARTTPARMAAAHVRFYERLLSFRDAPVDSPADSPAQPPAELPAEPPADPPTDA